MLGCARHQGNGKYQFISLERDSKSNRAYGKAFDNRTVLRETVSETVQIGVNIDVFPIDDVPDDEQQWNAYNKTRVKLQKLYAIKTYSPRSEWSICKKLGLAMGKLALLAVSSRLLAQTLQKMAVKHNDEYLTNCYGDWRQLPPKEKQVANHIFNAWWKQ